MKLHLGCFDQPAHGWYNTDVTPHLWVARVPLLASALRAARLLGEDRYRQHRAGVFRTVHYLDVRKRFPFEDNSLDAVFSSHVLEHLYPDDARACLCEVFRTLKRGGICRIVVPDLDAVVREYQTNNPEPFLKAIFETARASKNAHHWHYTEASLTKLLLEVGFRESYRSEFRQGRCPDVERLDNRPESLFVEAVK